MKVDALCRTNVDWARHVIDNCVEHGLNALVLERRATQHGHEVECEGALTNGPLDLCDGERLAAEVLLHQLVVAGGDGLKQLFAVLVGDLDHVGWDVGFVPLGAEFFVVPNEGLHLDEVDETNEWGVDFHTAGTNWQVQHGWSCLKAVLHHLHRAVEVGADAVHLVDEAHARHVVLVGLAPHGLGLRLNASNRVEHGDGAVEYAQRALYFDGEVHVAGGVDDVDAVVVPDARGGSRGNGDTTLLLLGHVVHRGCTVVHLTDLVALACVIQDALGRRGLTSVDVSHDADIASALEWKFALCHLSTSSVCVVLDRGSSNRSRSQAQGAMLTAGLTTRTLTRRRSLWPLSHRCRRSEPKNKTPAREGGCL